MANRLKHPERSKTDGSLKEERERTDVALRTRASEVAEDADALVRLARQRADAVLQQSRVKSDEAMVKSGVSAAAMAAVYRERELEDLALVKGRKSEDTTRNDERFGRDKALDQLLTEERARTDQHLAHERLRSDDVVASRDDFLAAVAHDLKNLISMVSLNAAQIVRAASSDEPGRRSAHLGDKIQQVSVWMNRLVNDLMDVSTIESGRLSVSANPQQAQLLVTEIVEAFGGAAAEAGITLRPILPATPLFARFDHDRMIQVLGNLIGNALKFTSKGGTITVTAESRDGQALFSVVDTGSGISAEKLDLVFEKFWQAERTDRRGHGLGLYICKRIVEAHGGRIWAERGEPSGAVFRFTLPAA